MKRILLVHYRSGERDGVSLEMEKRKAVLSRLGHEVFLLSGYDPRSERGGNGKILTVRELDFTRRLPGFLRECFFQEKVLDQTLAWLIYKSEEERVYSQVSKVLVQIKPDFVFVHNLFSHAFHLPGTTGLLLALDHHRSKVIAVHHDFFWERSFFTRPRYLFIRDIVENLPPKRDYIYYHQVINSLALGQLLEKREIRGEKIKDYFDFSLELPKADNFNGDLLEKIGADENDLVVLQATRVTERKAIENAIIFTAELARLVAGLKREFMFKGKRISSRSKVHLFLPNFVEAGSEQYFKRLKMLAEEVEVNFAWLGDNFSQNRFRGNGTKVYSLWDAYAVADLVTYPSYWEGYGNQLLEAIWARKLAVLFEYPVFKKDIEGIGFKVVSLGDKMRRTNGFMLVPKERIMAAAKETMAMLTDESRYLGVVERNLKLAERSNGIGLLEDNLVQVVGRN